MIRGLRDSGELKALNLSKRLEVRLGALLSRGLACSEALLEAAGRGSPLEQLLLGPDMLEKAAALDAEALKPLAAAAGVGDKLALVATDEGRVLALEEELLAQQGWEQAAPEGATALAELARSGALAPTAGAADRARAELFPPAEIERLKLTALTSARADEAVSALRRLACAPIAAAARGEVFIRALAAADPAVRAEAARLLAGVGLPAGISEALAHLAAGGEQEKHLAIERLGKALADRAGAAGAAADADLVLVAALVGMTAALGAERSVPLRGRILAALGGAAGVLGAFPERLAEVLRQVVEMVITDYQAAAPGAYDLLAALARSAPAALYRQLRTELDGTRDARARAFLLVELAALRRAAPGVAGAGELAAGLAGELAASSHGDPERQALGGELFKLPGPEAAGAILEVFGRAGPAVQRYFLRLLADLCRFREVPGELVERAGRVFLECLKGARKELRLGVLETLLAADPRLSGGLRAELAAAYLEGFQDLTFRTDVELAESAVARMGQPALAVLLERLGPSWGAAERVRACRVVGEIGRLFGAAAAGDERLAGALADAERRLLEAALAGFPDKREMAVALGKLAGGLPRCREALETAWRRIEELGVSKPARLEAWSHLAASAAASAEMVETAATGLLEALAEPEPESLGQVTEVHKGAERLLELSDEASEYVNAMPVIVRSLVRVALAPAAEATVRRRVLTALVNRWKEQVGGRRLWGPAAATGLIEGLRDLAMGGAATAADRLAVVRALGLRLADPPAMRAISEVLAADGADQELAAPAASAALALLALRDARGRFPAEDRAEILAALARILGRTALETGTPRSARLRERIAAELFEGLRDEVPGVFEALSDLAGVAGLGEPLRAGIKERLAARRALVAPRQGQGPCTP